MALTINDVSCPHCGSEYTLREYKAESVMQWEDYQGKRTPIIRRVFKETNVYGCQDCGQKFEKADPK